MKMNVSRPAGLVGAIVGAALAACGPRVVPGLEVTIVVVGNQAPGERVTRIEAVFDRAMVPPRALGRPVEGAPLTIEPAAPGQFTWREDRKLVFEPKQALPRATRFVLRIPRGTVALDGRGLTREFQFDFETERLTLQTSFKRDFRLPDPKRWAVPEQAMRLAFNQPVSTNAIAKHCQITGGDERVALAVEALAGDDAAGEAQQLFEARPQRPLALDREWRFTCEDALAGNEGPLGLAASPESRTFDQLNGGLPDGQLAFRTFGPMKVASIYPSGTDVDPDSGRVRISFSNPPAAVEAQPTIELSPRPRDMSEKPSFQGDDIVYNVSDFEPRTEYTLTVPAGITDVFGQAAAQPHQATFRTGDVTPGFSLETGSWSVEDARGVFVGWARNIKRLEVRAAAVSPEELFRVLPALDWWDDDAADLDGLRLPQVKTELAVAGQPNRWGQVVFDPTTLLGPQAGKPRLFYLAARAPETVKQDENAPFREVLLNVTNLGVSSKLSGSAGLVWVTRLSDGTPQAGAEVIVRERSGQVLWRGRTGEDGSVKTPGREALLAKVVSAKKNSAEAEEAEDEGWAPVARLLIFARVGDDLTFVDPDARGGFASWNFGVPTDWERKAERLRGFLHTDRGLYRPGDTIHLRGLARIMRLGQGLGLPRAERARVVVRDPQGNSIKDEQVPLSRYGGFHLDVSVGEDASLGDYRVEASLPQGSFFQSFTVEEYRPATFEVAIKSEQAHVFAGKKLHLEADGRYFYGAPVRGANVTWRVHSRERDVYFPQWGDFDFEDGRRHSHDVEPWGVEAFFTEETRKLDDGGRNRFSLPLPPDAFNRPTTLMVSAAVSDETSQTVAANFTVPLHRTRVYLGIDSGGYMIPSGKPHALRVVMVDHRGKPVAGNARLTVNRRNWSCAWESWGYRGSYRCTSQDEEVLTTALTLTNELPVVASFTPPAPGEYWAVATSTDSAGEEVAAARALWVWGRGDSPWQVDDSGRFDLVADKKEYQIGDTARLLVKAPVAGAMALLTIERDGVLSHQVLRTLADGDAIEVPITRALAPNAYVSLLLARGRTGPGARGLPKVAMGVTTLTVSTADRRLKVQVATDRESYRPGDPVTADLVVTDADDRPVRAEVALAAADEGVLSLIAYKTPDPLATFHAPWGLAVSTATQYERLAQLPEPDQERYATGGDAAGRPGTFRARFRATAYWSPAVETDGSGKARVSFPAPDNLTAFRLMAVAADSGDRFGAGERRFAVNKPLQLLSALPRFATVGDVFDAAVMVTNETGAAGDAEVRIEAEGLTLTGDRQTTVHLDKGGRARAAFPVRISQAGQARLRFFARMSTHKDGLEQIIPLHEPTAPEVELLSQGHTDKSVNVAVTLPEGVVPGSATLELSLDPDGLAGIENSLRDLVQYPYGCLEQTTSRLIPLVAAKEIARGLGLAEIEGNELDRFVRIAVQKIGKHQTGDGGFGAWPGNDAELYLTAYALWGLKLAADAGYAVDRNRIDNGVEHLRRALASEPRSGGHYSIGGEKGTRAFALYVLHLLERPEPGFVTAMLEDVASLPRFGVAFLARALAGVAGTDNPRVAELLASLEAAFVQTRDGIEIGEPANLQRLDWYMSSNTRTSAIVTDAFLALRPDHPDIPRLVHGLLERRRHGTWYTTQENLFALVALTNYVKARAGQGATVTLARGDAALGSVTLGGKGGARLHSRSLPIDGKDLRPLRISAQDGTVHYLVRLRFRRDAQHQPAVSKGFTLTRSFHDPETGAVLERVREGLMVRVKLVFDGNGPKTHVALSDFLPAGLEPINTRFVTTADALPPEERAGYGGWMSHRDLRDERVDAFWNDTWSSTPITIQYLARATTTGTFVVPAATVLQMYDPDNRGRTALETFTVEAR